MPFLLVRHKVKNYDMWKPVFDEHGAVRKASGSKGGYLYRNKDDLNEVVVLLEWDTLEKAKEFASSEDLRETMQRAGVIDKPDIYFLDEAKRVPV